MMLTDDFITLVWSMRTKQKAYFNDKTRSNLIAAKQAESKVDKWLTTATKVEPLPTSADVSQLEIPY